jgi:putative FmdB family regulatory protein
MTDRGWGEAARPGPTAPHTATDPSDPGGATVPIFVYRCDCGNRFERLVPRDADAPACPACGSDTRKIPAGPRLGRMGGGKPAGPAAARADVPIPWRGVVGGGAEKVHREVEFRQRLEAKAVSGLRVPGGPDLPTGKGSGDSSSASSG